MRRQLTTFADLPHGTNFPTEDAMGIMQHHDAITGTEKTAVEKDYHRILTNSVEVAVENVNKAFKYKNNLYELSLINFVYF